MMGNKIGILGIPLDTQNISSIGLSAPVMTTSEMFEMNSSCKLTLLVDE